MAWWSDMKDRAVGRAYARYLRALENLSPAKLCREAEAGLLAAFRRAARDVPAYGQILAAAGVAPQMITTVEQFCDRVPILDKRSIFEGHRLRDLCVGGTLRDVGLFYTSSGHSGVFPPLEVKVIRLIRDGRGVALTYTDPAQFADAREPALRGGGTGGRRDRERLSIAAAAREWRRSNEEAENMVRTLKPQQWIEVRYEELCAAPQTVLPRVFRHLNLDPQQAAADFRSVEHHVVGNGMRLDTTSEVRLDERWRSSLSSGDLRQFEAEAGSLNRHYGYI
jgi:hypothetical protein